MKRLAGETAIYGVSSIVGKFLNWMLVPMYTRVLATESDYVNQGLRARDSLVRTFQLRFFGFSMAARKTVHFQSFFNHFTDCLL